MKILVAALPVFFAAAVAAAAEPDTYRGMRLYNANCGVCHAESMHERDRSKVRNLADLRAQVVRWSEHANHKFTEEEIDDLVAYLNRWHYRLGGSS